MAVVLEGQWKSLACVCCVITAVMTESAPGGRWGPRGPLCLHRARTKRHQAASLAGGQSRMLQLIHAAPAPADLWPTRRAVTDWEREAHGPAIAARAWVRNSSINTCASVVTTQPISHRF
jgi:hypothetical protein